MWLSSHKYWHWITYGISGSSKCQVPVWITSLWLVRFLFTSLGFYSASTVTLWVQVRRPLYAAGWVLLDIKLCLLNTLFPQLFFSPAEDHSQDQWLKAARKGADIRGWAKISWVKSGIYFGVVPILPVKSSRPEHLPLGLSLWNTMKDIWKK